MGKPGATFPTIRIELADVNYNCPVVFGGWTNDFGFLSRMAQVTIESWRPVSVPGVGRVQFHSVGKDPLPGYRLSPRSQQTVGCMLETVHKITIGTIVEERILRVLIHG